MSEFVVQGFEARRGFEGVLPEPVVFDSDCPRVLGWSERMLKQLDELGVVFPAAVSLYGPVMVSAADGSVVRVWYANDFRWLDDLVVTDGAVRIVDALMAGLSVNELLSFDDKRFLSWFYPTWEDASVNHSNAGKEVAGV